MHVGDESTQLTGPQGSALTADSAQPKDNGVRCVSDGCAVYASVAKTVHLPLPLSGESVVVRGVYYAAPVVGATAAAPGHCLREAWVSADPSAIP